MKTLLKLSAGLLVVLAGWLAGASDDKGAPQPRVQWEADLAVIRWAEPLADVRAGPKETPFSILTGPYLGRLDSTSATIGWEVVAEKSLTTMPFASLSANYDLAKMQFRSVTLSGLKPDTVYRYRLETTDGHYTGPEYRFRTLPAADSKRLRFAVIGDTQRFATQPWTDVNRRLYADIMAWDPPLLLHMGDIVYSGWGEGINGRKEWFRVFNLMRDLRATRWLAPAMGNHDVKVGQQNWGPDYFRDLPGGTAGAQPPFYYSFDAANVHFVALSTEQRRSGPKKEDLSAVKVYDRYTWRDQLAWLEEDLRNCKAPWKVVYFHQPLHTVGGYPASAEFRNDFGPLFDKYGVQLILSGHDHSYQRTRRLINATRMLSDTGSVQVVSGGASNQFERNSKPDWNVLHVKLYHYLRVEVNDDTLRVECINDEGKLYESWQLKQVGQPETLQPPPQR